MSEQQITLKKQRLPFTQVPNELLCSNAISGLAKALWCVLYSKPDEWVFYWNEILTNFKEGKKALRTAKKELESAGYLLTQQRKVLTGRGREWVWGGMEMTLFYTPIVLENQGSSPDTLYGNAGDEESGSGNAGEGNTKKDLKNKDLSKKDLFSLSEMESYARERNFNIDVKAFYDWCCNEEKLKRNWKNIMTKWAAKPENQIKPAVSKMERVAKESPEIIATRDKIKFLVGNAWQYFMDHNIENNTIYVTDTRALQYQPALEKIGIKIEMK